MDYRKRESQIQNWLNWKIRGLPTIQYEKYCKIPAANHLFTIVDIMKKILEEKAQLYHLVALYLCKHTRQFIQTAIAFLCTSVKQPDDHDFKNLIHVTQYM